MKNGTRLGEYDNGKTAVAFVDNGYRSYFYGGTKVTAELLRALAKRENISIYTEAGDAFFKLGNVAVLHTCSAGEKTLQLGEGVWKEIRENQVYQGRIRFTSERAKTFIFIKQ